MKSKVLVTGSKGQLGSEIKKATENIDDIEFLFSDIEELDIRDPEALNNYLAINKPSYLINCAGYTSVDKAEAEPETAMTINATSVKNIAEALEGTDCRLMHISTDYVLGGFGHSPMDEDSIPHPVSVYSKSKYQGELNALGYPHSMIIRTSWLYSSYGKNFVKTILRLATERDELNVVNDQEGSPTYAGDLAEALLTIIGKVEEGSADFTPGIYHYSNEGSCSWYKFAKAIMKEKEIDIKINPVTTEEFHQQAYRPAYSVLRKEKIKNIYGVTIPKWKKSLKKCLKLIN
jgi:dTDP-4-dehydrorhamnose reductase